MTSSDSWVSSNAGKTRALVAFSKAAKVSYLLGSHPWSFSKDARLCSTGGQVYTKTIYPPSHLAGLDTTLARTLKLATPTHGDPNHLVSLTMSGVTMQ